MGILEDIEFARECEEFSRQSPMLRYVASINPQATCKEFVAACVHAGYPANSATNRFHESRKFDCQEPGHSVDEEGRLLLNGEIQNVEC